MASYSIIIVSSTPQFGWRAPLFTIYYYLLLLPLFGLVLGFESIRGGVECGLGGCCVYIYTYWS